MRIILACEPNGFGPVSKLTAIARLLDGHERIFVGDGGAYAFARRNSDCYERLMTLKEFYDEPGFARSADLGMVVMEPDVVFQLLQMQVPVYLFDSLLEFWVLPRGMAPLAQAARDMTDAVPGHARAMFEGFSIHERKVLAHMLATRSFAQNYPGVGARLSDLALHGYGKTDLLGSIIDAEPRLDALLEPGDRGRWRMLINLGGVQNFAINFFVNDHTIGLMERWAERFLETRDDCEQIHICCGRYGRAESVSVGSGTLTREFADHQRFMQLLENADLVMSAPGRTTIHEAVHIGQVPLLLPEQHQNQFCNLRSLQGTRLVRFAVTLSDILGPQEDAVSDDAGTERIVAQTLAVLNDQDLFDRFDRLLRDRIDDLRLLGRAERQAILQELRDGFAGLDFTAALRTVMQSHARDAPDAKVAQVSLEA